MRNSYDVKKMRRFRYGKRCAYIRGKSQNFENFENFQKSSAEKLLGAQRPRIWRI